MKNLSQFNRFDAEGFLNDKKLAYLKAVPWEERNDAGEVVRTLGSRVSTLIVSDETDYGNSTGNNFGETLIIKVPDLSPNAFAKLVPLQTEVKVGEIERATVYGQYKNELSITATLEVAK